MIPATVAPTQTTHLSTPTPREKVTRSKDDSDLFSLQKFVTGENSSYRTKIPPKYNWLKIDISCTKKERQILNERDALEKRSKASERCYCNCIKIALLVYLGAVAAFCLFKNTNKLFVK